MVTARRLYLYGVLVASLVLLLVGLQELVRLPVSGLIAGLPMHGRHLVERRDASDLALAVSFVAVGGPLWLVHAWLLRRTSSVSPDARATELASPVRATFFASILAGTLCVAIVSLGSALATGVAIVMDAPGTWDADLGGSLATGLTVGVAWLAHIAWRWRDLRTEPGLLAGDWLTRAYLYGALLVLATVALVQGTDALQTGLRAARGRLTEWGDDRWWQTSLIAATTTAAVAAATWVTHWWMATRLCTAPDPMGPAHREARTRVGYLLGMVLLSVSMVCMLAATSLREALDAVLSGWPTDDPDDLLEQVGGPLVVAAPWVLAWWWHTQRALREAAVLGGAVRRTAVARSACCVVAAVGATAVAVGLILVLHTLLGALGLGAEGSQIVGRSVGAEIPESVATLAIGLLLWLPPWTWLQRQRTADPVAEARATARRVYLLLISGASVVAAMVGGAWLLYTVLRAVMETARLEDPPDGATALSVLVVAVAGLAVHLTALRRDLRVERAADEADEQAMKAGEGQHGAWTGAAGDGAIRMVESLRLTGPADADLDAVAMALCAQLPAGFTLEATGPAHRESATG